MDNPWYSFRGIATVIYPLRHIPSTNNKHKALCGAFIWTNASRREDKMCTKCLIESGKPQKKI